MFTIKDIACEIGLKSGTLRYWLKKNKEDVDANYYDFNLGSLFVKIKKYEKAKSRNNLFRKYVHLMVLDIDKFKAEFEKYINYVEYLKSRKRNSKTSWTTSAIDCYNCKMECNNCFNKEICLNLVNEKNIEPPMKNIVRKLLNEIGQP